MELNFSSVSLMPSKQNQQRVLITGGTGSWGNELVSQILAKYKNITEIRIYSRSEHKQVDMRLKFGNNPKLKFIIGDVRDKNILTLATKGVDIIFHLAALKHVPVCEENTWEAVLTNVIGTQNVIEAAIQNKVKTVVDVSTDKAVDPFNLYGVTKACGEKLMINANFNYTYNGYKNTIKFICIRGGNVIGTNGSVIPLFKKQLEESNIITVTNPHMTRYLMSTAQAIGLVLTAVDHPIGGELFVMKMPSTTIDIIAKVMVKLFGNTKSKIKIIGARPGEKIHEVLVSRNESPMTRIYSKDYFLIQPQIAPKSHFAKYRKLKAVEFTDFTSQNAYLLNQKELEEMLINEKWLWEEK